MSIPGSASSASSLEWAIHSPDVNGSASASAITSDVLTSAFDPSSPATVSTGGSSGATSPRRRTIVAMASGQATVAAIVTMRLLDPTPQSRPHCVNAPAKDAGARVVTFAGVGATAEGSTSDRRTSVGSPVTSIMWRQLGQRQGVCSCVSSTTRRIPHPGQTRRIFSGTARFGTSARIHAARSPHVSNRSSGRLARARCTASQSEAGSSGRSPPSDGGS